MRLGRKRRRQIWRPKPSPKKQCLKVRFRKVSIQRSWEGIMREIKTRKHGVREAKEKEKLFQGESVHLCWMLVHLKFIKIRVKKYSPAL